MSLKKVRLGDVLAYEQPTNYIVETENYSDKFKIPVLTAGKSFVLGYTNETTGIYSNLPAIIFDDFTTESKFVDFQFKVKSSAMKILTCDPQIADLKYLFYLLKTINFDAEQHKRYWISTFANFEISSLATQKSIAEILDAADALRRKVQELLKKYDELAQAIFIDMFGDPVKNEKGWEVKKFGAISNMKAGNFISASEIYSELDDRLYPCYGGNGLRGFVKSYTHNGNYILIGRQGALCGNVKITTGKFHATEHAVVCSPKIEYNVLWLYYLLGALNLNKYASGAAQPGLNVSTLVEIELIFTPIELQNQFAEKLELIDSQSLNLKGNLVNTNKLFNSLIQKAFKGELV